MDRLPNPTWLRSFEAAARYLSFTRAAEELGLTQTAVSLHIRSLEAALGAQLFARAARRLTLTELGESYSVTVRRSLSDIALSTTSLFGPDAPHRLTVRAPIATAALWLSHRLPDFAARHPGIHVRLVSSIWTGPGSTGAVDVELRLGHGDWPGVAADAISAETIVPVASAGAQRAWSDLPRIEILGYENAWARYHAAQGLPEPEGRAGFSVDTTVAALELVAAGGGTALVLERLARSAINHGHAIGIVGPPVAFDQAHYLLRDSGGGAPHPATRLFEGWLVECFAAFET